MTVQVTLHLYAWWYMCKCTCMHDSTCTSALVCKTIYAWQYNCKCTCMHDNICMIVQVQLYAWKYICKCTCMHDSTCASSLVCMTVHVKAHLYAWQYMCKHMKIVQGSQICRKIFFFLMQSKPLSCNCSNPMHLLHAQKSRSVWQNALSCLSIAQSPSLSDVQAWS